MSPRSRLRLAVCSHPAVKPGRWSVAPTHAWTEVPVAFIELRPGKSATEEELISFCQGRIAGYKVPRAVFFVNDGEWPMSATKVDKRALRARL